MSKTYTNSGGNYTPITQEYLYLHRDYQGTILAISGNNAVVKERRQFDAWGLLKKHYKNEVETPPTAFANADFEFLSDRGYTAHEHFFSVGIIHMNARLYDPVLHTFLSPDASITDPSNPQNYNRYAYALNNPLMYTDYSGNDPVTVAIVTAAIIGAVIGGVTYVGLSLYNGTAITWGGLAQSIIVGAISGAASGGIGRITLSISDAMCIATQTLSQIQINMILAIPGALMHGISQGMIQGVSGGNVEQSFVTAAISSLAGSGFGAIGGSANSVVGQSLFGALAGGVTSHLQGGNFWEGAAIGLTVGLLNHAGKKLYPAIDAWLNPKPNKYQQYFAQKLRESQLLTKLYKHYQNGQGADFQYEASNIQLKGHTQTSLGLVGKYTGEINLFEFGNKIQALAFGRIALTRVNDYQFVIEPNTFDFDYQSEASFSRNAGTFVGGAIFGRFFNTKYVFNLQPNMFIGGAFKVIFNGLITILK